MARIEVVELLISNHAADKLWSHGIATSQVHAVPLGRYVVRRNRTGRAAPFLLIGRDKQDRCLTIPIVPTDSPILWRVITAWYCKPSEAALLRQWRRIMEESIHYASTQEPLDDEERELMNPDFWDWDTPVEVVVAKDLRVQLPIEVTFEEHDLLSTAARAQGLTPHAFMKRVALEAARAAHA